MPTVLIAICLAALPRLSAAGPIGGNFTPEGRLIGINNLPIENAYGSFSDQWIDRLGEFLGSPYFDQTGLDRTLRDYFKNINLRDPAARAGLAPVVHNLEAFGYGPSYLSNRSAETLEVSPEEQLQTFEEAVKASLTFLQKDARSLVKKIPSMNPEDPAFPVAAAKLYMLHTLFPIYIPEQRTSVEQAYKAARERLSAEQRQIVETSIERTIKAMDHSLGAPLTVVEAVAAQLPKLPARLTTRRIELLRAEPQKTEPEELPTYILRFGGKEAQAQDIEKISKIPGIKILDSSPKMLVVQGDEAKIKELINTLSGWKVLPFEAGTPVADEPPELEQIRKLDGFDGDRVDVRNGLIYVSFKTRKAYDNADRRGLLPAALGRYSMVYSAAGKLISSGSDPKTKKS